MTIRLAPLSDADPQAVENLLDAAFGIDRHSRTAYRIREGMPVIDALSFAAFAEDVLVGSIQSWPVALGDAAVVLVGPVAVAPDRQRAGVGRKLMERLIETAPEAPMAMIGDPEYYGRFFGFTAEATGGWAVPGPVERRRLLARNAEGLPRTGTLGPRTFALGEVNA
ncbi:GNAT family N-acetyltransferase [Sphingomonas sp. SUN039]|uniref:GNAT family N-acetyltransferase n=1 Tax=Sphingomonas sp. SUN039 TaxID=2937787 RepID=UPI00216437B3|nr:N-acetyltransferase [Sphingomonas sp. SUN039]UVO52718.1 N-acetyltransferase [Sphingomonas sp. SUN039]